MRGTTQALMLALLVAGPGVALADDAQPKVIEEEILAPPGTARATLAPEAGEDHLFVGGTLVSLGGKTVQATNTQEAMEAAKFEAEYEEFLSRGRYSRVRSIGVGYSGGGSSYAISRPGARAVRTDYTESSVARRPQRTDRFSLSNGPVSLGRSSGRPFATISRSRTVNGSR